MIRKSEPFSSELESKNEQQYSFRVLFNAKSLMHVKFAALNINVGLLYVMLQTFICWDTGKISRTLNT